MWKQASTACLAATRRVHARAHIADEDGLAGVANIDAGRVEPDADILPVTVELAVVEWRQHHVVHAVAGRDVRQQRAHQQPGERGVAVGEVVDIGLPRPRARRQPEAVEAGIAEVARVRGRHRVASEPEESERAPLKAVRRFFAAAAEPDEIVAVADGLEDGALLLDGPARERIARRVVERQQLRLALRRDRKRGDELVRAAWHWPGSARARRLLPARARPAPARRVRTPRAGRTPRGRARATNRTCDRRRSRTARSRLRARAAALSPRRCNSCRVNRSTRCRRSRAQGGRRA